VVSGVTPVARVRSSINLTPYATATLNLKFAVTPKLAVTLTAGTQYYFVVKLTSGVKESDAVNGGDANNIAASAKYEFVGTPHVGNVFTSGKYFRLVRDTLNSVDPFVKQGVPTPIDGKHFTAAFESRHGYDQPNLGPYLDSRGIPTIGIGLNLNTLDPTTMSQLAAAVRTFYAARTAQHDTNYHNIDKLTDGQVINMLKTQARALGGKQGRDALTTADAQALFDSVYAEHAQDAEAAIGQTLWESLPASVQWTLTDIDFNTGSITNFPQLVADVQASAGPDLIRAGFDLLDSKRTNQVQYWRSLADYEFLLQGSHAELGRLIS
jgi:hypothetical protein